MKELKKKIRTLAELYASNLKDRIEERKEAMKSDDNSHYLIYRVLGITTVSAQNVVAFSDKPNEAELPNEASPVSE